MYILAYDFAALLMNMINLIVFVYMKNLRDRKSGVLFVMLLNSLLTTSFDMLSSIAIGHPETYSQTYCLIITNIYYFLNNNKIYIYINYLLILVGIQPHTRMWRRLLVSVPYLVTTVLILMNPFTHIMFRIDADLGYHREMGLGLLYIIAFMYLTFWSLNSLSYIKKMERTVFRAYISFVLIYILSALLQTLYPQYLIQSFATAMCELVAIMVLLNRKEVIDGTTEIYNRNAFYDKLQSIIASNAPTSVTLIMLEDAARINYTLGYRYLTKIIQEVARFLKRNLKLRDSYYIRNGCYAVLCTDPSDQKCVEIRRRLADRFNEQWYINNLTINLSVRIAQFMIPDQIDSYSYVYEYINNMITARSSGDIAKQTGMTEISFNDHFREQQVRKAVTLALENKSFEVYYQPIYSVSGQCYASAEALVRLRDPELGFIPPDEFIPITEKDGTITILGMQIFEKVCSILNHSELDQAGIQFIEINLSVVQCMQKNIKEQLLNLMKEYNIHPKQICLEITETVAVNTPETVRSLFQELSKHGITFALDDYGKGYSNLNYILELPFHYVKLDRGIIWNYFEDDIGKITLESNIAMMKSLGIELIAEGVETREQAEALMKLGVNYLQGYYFSRPIPPEDYIRFILENNKA